MGFGFTVRDLDLAKLCRGLVKLGLSPDIEVPTLDTVRSAALLELLVSHGHNVACVGPTGTGKTLTVEATLGRGLPPKFIADFICFSARTSANQTQASGEQNRTPVN